MRLGLRQDRMNDRGNEEEDTRNSKSPLPCQGFWVTALGACESRVSVNATEGTPAQITGTKTVLHLQEGCLNS